MLTTHAHNNLIELSYPDNEAPTPRFSSKISSPTKRTLNNKNFLAEDAPCYNYTNEESYVNSRQLDSSQFGRPIPGPIFNQKPANTVYRANGSYQMHSRVNTFHGNIRDQTRCEVNKAKQRLGGLSHDMPIEAADSELDESSPPSFNRHQKPGSQRIKAQKYIEIQNASKINAPDIARRQSCLMERYFSEPINLGKMRRETGKLKPIINITNSDLIKAPRNGQVYKLTEPILSSDKSFQIVSSEIENIYRPKYHLSQSLSGSGNKSVKFSNLEEIKHKDANNSMGSSMRPQHLPLLGRRFMSASSANDSFELSFDGKALDRSDIFRMVDSFSVALSDDDDEDGLISATNKNLLPAEMTNSVC